MSTDTEADIEADKQADADAAVGVLLRGLWTAVLIKTNLPVNLAVVLNAAGGLLERAFLSAPFDSHADRLEEFDNWAKYTRDRIEAVQKKGLN